MIKTKAGKNKNFSRFFIYCVLYYLSRRKLNSDSLPAVLRTDFGFSQSVSISSGFLLEYYQFKKMNMEAYRSGHNGPDSKSGSPHGLVGSNPTASAKKKHHF